MALEQVWTYEARRLMREAEADLRPDGLQDPLILSRLDLGLNSRLSNLALGMALATKLVWLRHGWVDGDTFSVTSLDVTSARGKQARLPCPICDEFSVNGLMGLQPCCHSLCPPCMRRHCESSKERQPMAPVRCPFCKQTVTQVIPVSRDIRDEMSYVKKGGSIISYIVLIERICEALHWAGKATDPQERPPLSSLPVKLVRLSVVEGDGETVGTATALLEDGLKMQKVMMSTSLFGGSINERVTADGRYQCMWMDCLKVQEEGSQPFARCASCRIARYCSPECQKKAWWKGGHKRVCKKYKEVVDARTTGEEAGQEANGK